MTELDFDTWKTQYPQNNLMNKVTDINNVNNILSYVKDKNNTFNNFITTSLSNIVKNTVDYKIESLLVYNNGKLEIDIRQLNINDLDSINRVLLLIVDLWYQYYKGDVRDQLLLKPKTDIGNYTFTIKSNGDVIVKDSNQKELYVSEHKYAIGEVDQVYCAKHNNSDNAQACINYLAFISGIGDSDNRPTLNPDKLGLVMDDVGNGSINDAAKVAHAYAILCRVNWRAYTKESKIANYVYTFKDFILEERRMIVNGIMKDGDAANLLRPMISITSPNAMVAIGIHSIVTPPSTPNGSRNVSRATTPNVSPSGSRATTPNVSPSGSRATTPNASPSGSRATTPNASPNASRNQSPNTSSGPSRMPSPMTRTTSLDPDYYIDSATSPMSSPSSTISSNPPSPTPLSVSPIKQSTLPITSSLPLQSFTTDRATSPLQIPKQSSTIGTSPMSSPSSTISSNPPSPNTLSVSPIKQSTLPITSPTQSSIKKAIKAPIKKQTIGKRPDWNSSTHVDPNLMPKTVADIQADELKRRAKNQKGGSNDATTKYINSILEKSDADWEIFVSDLSNLSPLGKLVHVCTVILNQNTNLRNAYMVAQSFLNKQVRNIELPRISPEKTVPISHKMFIGHNVQHSILLNLSLLQHGGNKTDLKDSFANVIYILNSRNKKLNDVTHNKFKQKFEQITQLETKAQEFIEKFQNYDSTNSILNVISTNDMDNFNHISQKLRNKTLSITSGIEKIKLKMNIDTKPSYTLIT
jgi:hypothetical protein